MIKRVKKMLVPPFSFDTKTGLIKSSNGNAVCHIDNDLYRTADLIVTALNEKAGHSFSKPLRWKRKAVLCPATGRVLSECFICPKCKGSFPVKTVFCPHCGQQILRRIRVKIDP
jgi:hypothetical protein